MYKLQDEEYKEPDNFDEMTDEEKDAISHRGNALRDFRKVLLEKIGG